MVSYFFRFFVTFSVVLSLLNFFLYFLFSRVKYRVRLMVVRWIFVNKCSFLNNLVKLFRVSVLFILLRVCLDYVVYVYGF